MQGDRGHGAVGDPPFRVSLHRRERLEQGDAVGRADTLEPMHRPSAGVEGTVFRKHPNAFDLAIEDPEPHDHLLRPLELDHAR